MGVTIRDIADRLKISHSTVSRALRNHSSISPYTRERVQQVAKEMGYRANQSARALASRKVRSISLVIPDVVDPFYGRIIEGVDQVAHERSYALLLYVTHSDRRREQAAVEDAAVARYDGTILFRRHLPLSKLRAAIKEGTPFILLTRHEPGLGVDSIRVDDVDGGYKAGEHLLRLGHRRIAFLSGPGPDQESQDRLTGFRRACNDFGVPFDPALLFPGNFTEQAGAAAVNRWLAEPPEARPTAVFAGNDRMAIGVIKRAQEVGLDIPGALSVVGYDDIESCRYTTPTLTTVRQPTREMGAKAADLLIRRLEGETFSPQEILLKTELVVRASTRPPSMRKERSP